MAEAILLLTLFNTKRRKSYLTSRISDLQTYKSLATYAQGDVRSIYAQEKNEVVSFYKSLYKEDEEYNGKYTDYTEIPEYQEEIERLSAKMQEELEALDAEATQRNQEITVASAELEELNAYEESWKSMLNSNIQNDFNYAQG